MNIVVQLGKALLEAVASKVGQEVGQEIGKAIGDDLARTYCEWRKRNRSNQ